MPNSLQMTGLQIKAGSKSTDKQLIRHGRHSCTYLDQELLEIPRDNGLDNFTIDVCQPDTHVGPEYQEQRQNNEVLGLLTVDLGHDHIQQLLNFFEENCIYISLPLLLIDKSE